MDFSINNVSIKKKVLGISFLLLFLLVSISIFSYSTINSIGGELKNIVEEDIPLTEKLAAITVHQLEQAIQFERALRFGALLNKEEKAAAHFYELILSFDKGTEEIEKEIKQAESIAEHALTKAHSKEAVKEFKHVSVVLKDVELKHKSFVVHVHKIFSLIKKGKLHKAELLAEEVEKEEDALNKEIEELLFEIEKFTHAAGKAAEQHEEAALSILGVVSIIAVFIGLLSSGIIARMICLGLSLAVNNAERIAKGDLTQKIEVNSKDEVGRLQQSLKTMSENLSNTVSDVLKGTNEISSASSEIAVGNIDLSQRTEEQASSLEETASSMEEMTSIVKQNSNHASEANQIAKDTRNQAEKAGEVVSNAVAAMGKITDSSKKIANIIGVIDEIAFQTNLLALNAAVEAARAGEQGRGFAVVASEVRTLAGRSADAAKEIKDLITDSVEKVEQGSELVNASGNSLGEIVTGVKKVTDIISEIAESSREQSNGIEQVNSAVMQMDEMTQQNAALVEEATAASRSLEEQAHVVNKRMEFFTVDISESDNKVLQAI